MKTIVTKGQYAAMKNRGLSAISNWIADGKITGAALVGEGVRAKIWVEQADADLVRRLDPSQQAAQDNPVVTSPTAAPSSGEAGQQVDVRLTNDDEDMRRRRRADADRAEEEAKAAARRNATEDGRWMDAAEAKRVWGREIARLLADTETFLYTTLARTIAERHGLDWKLLSTEIRQLYRQQRAEQAASATARRDDHEAELAEAAE